MEQAAGQVVEQIVEQGMLYDFYGPLLTGHQQEIYELVVYQNLSLNEIAEQKGISKQAVSDLVRRATAQMRGYEKSLGMIARFQQLRKSCEELQKAASGIQDKAAADRIRSLADEIRSEL